MGQIKGLFIDQNVIQKKKKIDIGKKWVLTTLKIDFI